MAVRLQSQLCSRTPLPADHRPSRISKQHHRQPLGDDTTELSHSCRRSRGARPRICPTCPWPCDACCRPPPSLVCLPHLLAPSRCAVEFSGFDTIKLPPASTPPAAKPPVKTGWLDAEPTAEPVVLRQHPRVPAGTGSRRVVLTAVRPTVAGRPRPPSNARKSRMVTTEELIGDLVLPTVVKMTPEIEHYMLFENFLLRQFIDKFTEEEAIIRERILVCAACQPALP